MNPERVIRQMEYLHPTLKERAQNAFLALQRDVPGICAFETWRTPLRQEFLYAKGRTTPGPKVTNAREWGSWHQYGLALDVAVLHEGHWSWDFDRDIVKAAFVLHELEPGPPFESAHFQLTGGLKIPDAITLSKDGQIAVWEAVTERLMREK